MTNHFKYLLSGLLMTLLFISCGSGRFINDEHNIDHEPQCGFEEVGDIESSDELEQVEKASPAANRHFEVEPVMDQTEVVPTQSNDQLSFVSETTSQNVIKDIRIAESQKRPTLRETFKMMKDVRKNRKTGKSNSGLGFAAHILLIILAIFIPWLSVGIYTGWDVKLTVITALLWILGWLPGVIFGMLVLFDVVG